MVCKSALLLASAFIVGALAMGLPAGDDLMLDLGDDTAVVESTVREARAAVPDTIDDLLGPGVKEAFLYSYGDEEDAPRKDEQGYRKRTQDKGNDGYKHFDSYHKNDGDKYGYETHSEYGQEHKAKADAGGKSRKSSGDDVHGETSDETKQAYKVVEDVKENKKGVRALEDDGDSGYYADSGDYSEAEAESEGGDEGESAGYTEGAEGGEANYEDGGYDGDAASEGGDIANYSSDAGYEDGDAEEEVDDDY